MIRCGPACPRVLAFLSIEGNSTAVLTKETAAAAWKEIGTMVSSQTRARTITTRLQLATNQKGNMYVA
jgi:hypothetical protein